MLREFGKIYTQIWQSKKFRSLDEGTKNFYLYLHSCKHGNAIGCFHLPILYAAADLHLDNTCIDTRIHTCIDTGLIEYDFDENIVFIHRFLDFSPVANPKHATGAIKQALQMPECYPKLLILKDLLKQSKITKASEIDLIDTGIDTCMKRVSIPVRDNKTKTETKTETKKVNSAKTVSHDEPELDLPDAPDPFEVFWEAFGDKRGRDKAKTVWDDIIPDDDLAEQVIAGAKRYALWRKFTKPKDATPKMAQGWLKDRRWEDEITLPGGRLSESASEWDGEDVEVTDDF